MTKTIPGYVPRSAGEILTTIENGRPSGGKELQHGSDGVDPSLDALVNLEDVMDSMRSIEWGDGNTLFGINLAQDDDRANGCMEHRLNFGQNRSLERDMTILDGPLFEETKEGRGRMNTPATPTNSRNSFLICTPPGRGSTAWASRELSGKDGRENELELANRVETLEGMTLSTKNTATEAMTATRGIEEIQGNLDTIHCRLDVVEEQALTQRAEIIEVERNIQTRIDDAVKDMREWFKQELKGIRDMMSNPRGGSVDDKARGAVKEIVKQIDYIAPKLKHLAGEIKDVKSVAEKGNIAGAKILVKMAGIELNRG